jgi:WD40 repeat protein
MNRFVKALASAALLGAGAARLWPSGLAADEPKAEVKERASLNDPTLVFQAAFRPDGKMPAAASQDIAVRVSDLTTNKELAPLNGHAGVVDCVAFSPDGKKLASGSRDNTIKLWHAAKGAEQTTLKGHMNGVKSLAFSPDGKTLASASADKTIKLWDVQEAT